MSDNENERANPETTWGASQEDKRQWAEQFGASEEDNEGALRSTEGEQGSTHPGSATTDGEAEPSKAELYEKAKELDIEGRSQMSKEELAQAVEEEGN